MTAVSYFPSPFVPGFRLVDGAQLNAVTADGQVSSTQSAVANGTTKATGTQITTAITNFGTVGASGIAILPPAVPGSQVLVFNNGANTLTLDPYETSGTTIDGGSSTTLTTANRVAMFFCVAPNVWLSALLGAVSS